VESLGNKLKAARESKGYTHDQVSQEIHISSRYLKALEEEEFSGFPGEPFLLGFLTNYSEYLGLDVQDMLSLYRAMKIQEEPVPVEQLLKKPVSPFPFGLLIGGLIILVILAAIGGGIYFFLYLPRTKTTTMAKTREAVEYILNTGFLERRFYPGDSILIPYGDDQYQLKLLNLGDAVTVSTPDREVILDLSQEVTVDLNNDGIEELRITAADFVKNESSAGALLRFELDGTLPLYTEENLSSAASGTVMGTIPPITTISNTGLANATVIFSSPSAYPFTLQCVFQGYCMFRWEILSERDRRERTERYYQKADELNLQAQNGIRIWVSNAATAKLQVIGGGRTVPLELGGAGEVVVADIRWVRDDESRYRLVLVRLD
jgi:cytoskeletal protein RodZ